MGKIPFNLILTWLKKIPMPFPLILSLWLLYLIYYTELLNHLLPFLQSYIQKPFQLLPLLLMVIVTLLILATYYFILSKRQYRRPKHYKYCPECDSGIDAKSTENYCSCGTKYLAKCPECNKKIIRDRSRVCSFCGFMFPTKPRTGNEWMGR